jgi:prevent-host-death family protein
MKATSLANAKAHLSELVDEAEHHGKRIMILRHGKPAAAIVPVAVAAPPKRERRMSIAEAEAFLRELGVQGDATMSPVDDLIRGRR